MDLYHLFPGRVKLHLKYFQRGLGVAYEKIKIFNLKDSLRNTNSCLDELIRVMEE